MSLEYTMVFNGRHPPSIFNIIKLGKLQRMFVRDEKIYTNKEVFGITLR